MSEFVLTPQAQPTSIAGKVVFWVDSDGCVRSIDENDIVTIYTRTFESASAPTVNDDVDLGYRKGDFWIHTGNTIYVCLSAADGAADWDDILAVGGGGVSDGDKGDIVVSSSGTVWMIDTGAVTESKIANDAVTTNKINNQAVTLAKLVNATAQYKLLARISSGAGSFEELTASANVLSLLQAADYAAIKALLDLEIGADVQAYNANLTTFAGIAPSANVQSVLGAADYAAIRTLLGLVIGTNVQAYDADLTTWAGVTPGTGVATALAIALNAAGGFATIDGTATLTNKRITPRVGSTTSSATPTINTDNVDFYHLTAQAVDITSFTTNLSGTPTDGQKLWIAITGTAARAITWGASFEAGAVALPTTTVTTQRLDVGFIWNAVTSKWRCMASGSA